MKTILALVALAALPAVARSGVHNQGMVKSHLWTSTAGLENARTSLRALTALANDATAWDATHARDLLREARGGVDFARAHERHLRQFATGDVAQDLARLDSDLNGARVLLGKLQGPIARGGTNAVQRLRDDLKAAWDRLDDARKDLDKVASDYDTTTKLPEP